MRRVSKPWGEEIIFAETERYAGKVLVVRKGEILSLQYHDRKDETFYLARGKARLWIAEAGALVEVFMNPGDARRVRPGTRHRLEALEDSELFEVSTPELDDVVRLEDRYGRSGRKDG
ncbi:MAG TPA: cupin domain-containing protein [Candidatus Polarisedimenticolia bacterium]|nr:cupin domain-containing protein [Candidatus Polarisedimenticolia bacterium]